MGASFSQADQSDLGREFQDRVAGLLAEFRRQIGERSGQDPGPLVGNPDGWIRAVNRDVRDTGSFLDTKYAGC